MNIRAFNPIHTPRYGKDFWYPVQVSVGDTFDLKNDCSIEVFWGNFPPLEPCKVRGLPIPAVLPWQM